MPTDNKQRAVSRLALVIVLSALLMGSGGLALYLLNRATPVPASWGASGGARNDLVSWFNALQATFAGPLMTGTLGVLILRRRVARPIGLLLVTLCGILGMQALASEYAVYGAYTAAVQLPGTQLAAWLTNFIWILLFIGFLLLFAIFPNSRFISSIWTGIILPPLAITGACLIGAALIESPMSSSFGIANPFFENTPTLLYDILFTTGVAGLLVSILIVMAAVLVRFRTSQGRHRQQMKWMLAGVAAMLFLFLVGIALTFGLDITAGGVLVNVSILAPVVGIGVALVRHQLYDIDIIIRRTLLYSTVSAVLALIYFGSVVLLQTAFSAFATRSPLAIVLSTLLIAALFNPLRRRVQTLIDRRFYRRTYEAAQVLERFAQTARDEVDLVALEAALQRVVADTVQPAGVAIWLKERPIPKKPLR